MRRWIIMLALLGALILTACGAAAVPTPPPDADNRTATPPDAGPEAYPAQPSPTPLPDNYPAAPPTPEATAEPTAYPADQEIWIVRPLGQQCVDPSTYEFPTLDAATAALADAGIEVLTAEEVVRHVCESCDCSTSEHYRVQIRAADLGAVQSLGWFLE